MVDFQNRCIAEVFPIICPLFKLLIHVDGQCQLLLRVFFLRHLTCCFFEMSDRIVIFLFQFIHVAQGLDSAIGRNICLWVSVFLGDYKIGSS